MKSFTFLRLPLVILGFGGLLALAPQSRAQSDVAPDHFDGTDSWAAAASAKPATAQALAANAKPHYAATLQARNNKPASPALQPVAARTATIPRRSDAAVTKKRNPATPKSSN
jgi:hypothetical protein